MKKRYKNQWKKAVTALCMASVLCAGGVSFSLRTAGAETVSVYDVIPESVTIELGSSLGDAGLPDNELGSLSWVNPDYVPQESAEECRAYLYPADGVDLTGKEEWDWDEGALVVYITVYVNGAEEEQDEEETWEEEPQETYEEEATAEEPVKEETAEETPQEAPDAEEEANPETPDPDAPEEPSAGPVEDEETPTDISIAAEEAKSSFGLAGSDTVVGGEIAEGNYSNPTETPAAEPTKDPGVTSVPEPASQTDNSQGNAASASNPQGQETTLSQAGSQNIGAVQTGDDTNITPMVIMIICAAAVIIAAFILLLLKRKK